MKCSEIGTAKKGARQGVRQLVVLKLDHDFQWRDLMTEDERCWSRRTSCKHYCDRASCANFLLVILLSLHLTALRSFVLSPRTFAKLRPPPMHNKLQFSRSHPSQAPIMVQPKTYGTTDLQRQGAQELQLTFDRTPHLPTRKPFFRPHSRPNHCRHPKLHARIRPDPTRCSRRLQHAWPAISICRQCHGHLPRAVRQCRRQRLVGPAAGWTWASV